MTILSLELSSDRRAAAVWADGRLLAEHCTLGGRETSAPGLIQAALKEAGCLPAHIDRIALGLGPGSYTGIRRAIATAIGWHLAHGTPVCGVNSFDVLAAEARSIQQGPLLLAADAQKGEWAIAEARAGIRSGPLQLIPRPELLRRLRDGITVVTPDAGLEGAIRLFPTASGAAVLASGLPATDPAGLAPVYLRDAVFAKAPPPRILG